MPTTSSSFGRNPFWKIAAQVAIIAGLGLAAAVFTMPGQQALDPAADYRTLSSAPVVAAGKANVLIKFSEGLASADANRISAEAGLQLVGVPNAAGAWKAVAAPARRDAVLDTLRADPHVAMAEPIDGEPNGRGTP